MDEEQVLALAGIFQAINLVNKLASSGKCNEQALQVSIRSLLQTNPKTTVQIYGTEYGCTYGLETLLKQSTQHTEDTKLIAKYFASILYLEKKLRTRTDLLELIRHGIKRAEIQARHFPLTHNNVLSNLGSLYSDTISCFNYKIMIIGKEVHLTNPIIINKIRACLLAAIRSAVLWRQLNGSRWQILIQRKNMLRIAQRILQRSLKEPTSEFVDY